MRATRVTSDEFQSDFTGLSVKARQEPVIITQGGEDRLVVVSVEEWVRLSRRELDVISQALPIFDRLLADEG